MVENPKHSLRVLYESFEGRCPDRRQPSKQEEDLPFFLSNFDSLYQGLLGSPMSRAVSYYARIQKGDIRNMHYEHALGESESQLCLNQSMGGKPPTSFDVSKTFTTFRDDLPDLHSYPPRLAGTTVESTSFRLISNKSTGPDVLGDFLLERGGMSTTEKNEWLIAHQLVDERFRGKGVGSALLDTMESFVSEQAKTRGMQKIVANVTQPGALIMLLNRDYTPRTPEDQQKLDRYLRADKDLVLDHAMTPVLGDDGQIEKWEPRLESDVFCFETSTSEKREGDAFRISLEKEFLPSQRPLDRVRDRAFNRFAGLFQWPTGD